jgi:hypothetical protein
LGFILEPVSSGWFTDNVSACAKKELPPPASMKNVEIRPAAACPALKNSPKVLKRPTRPNRTTAFALRATPASNHAAVTRVQKSNLEETESWNS